MQKPWTSLIRPKRLDVDPQTLTSTYGKFSCEPLARGYGVTLGNSLRRVLLGSLVGSAVSAVKFEGPNGPVEHEFSAIPEVTEDVNEIVLNLKEVRVKLHGVDTVKVVVEKTGPGVLKAGDIVSDKLTIINPDHHLCTVGRNGKLRIEVTIETGRGYVPAERINLPDGADLFTLPIDALYSPVTKVNYLVTNSRVGQKTDYDKLTMEIFTNGTVRPDDALALSAKILKEQLAIFINFEEDLDDTPAAKTTQDEFNKNLLRSVDELELSVRSANCLQNANIRFIYELVQRSEPEMLKTKNFGRKSLNEIRDILNAMGLHLGMKLDNFPPPGVTLPPTTHHEPR